MAAAHRLFYAGSAAAITLGLAGAARADSNPFSVQINTNPNLGNVVAAASGPTSWRIDDGTTNVTALSGSGFRPPSSGGDPRGKITISCGSDSLCNSPVAVTIVPVSVYGGRGQQLDNATVTMISGRVISGRGAGTTAGPGAPLTFTLSALGVRGSAQFYLGIDFPLAGDDSGRPNGSSFSTYSISVAPSPGYNNWSGTLGVAQAYVNRPLGLAVTGALNFGSLIRPSGSGVAAVSQDNGLYYNYNVTPLPGSTPSRAVFSATGEANKQISISIPHDFNLVGKSGSVINVVLSSNAGSTESLNNNGSYTFGVGGSMNLSSSTLTGVYSGSFAVSICYD